MSTWDEEYAGDPETFGKPYPELVSFVLANVRVGTALDLGCGQGRNALWLAAQGWQVTAVDSSAIASEQLRRAAAAGELPVRTRVGAVEQFGSDTRFDLVLADMVLHHVEEVPSRVLLQVWSRLVGDGGVLCVVTPGPDDDAAEVRQVAAAEKDWELVHDGAVRHFFGGEELTFHMIAVRRHAASDG